MGGGSVLACRRRSLRRLNELRHGQPAGGGCSSLDAAASIVAARRAPCASLPGQAQPRNAGCSASHLSRRLGRRTSPGAPRWASAPAGSLGLPGWPQKGWPPWEQWGRPPPTQGAAQARKREKVRVQRERTPGGQPGRRRPALRPAVCGTRMSRQAQRKLGVGSEPRAGRRAARAAGVAPHLTWIMSSGMRTSGMLRLLLLPA